MSPRDQAVRYLAKAALDEALLDEVIGTDRVSDEVVGFHCQQAAEKLLKALLAGLGISFRRTHDLRELIDTATTGGCGIPEDLRDLDMLTPYGTVYRYEDMESVAPLDRQGNRRTIANLRAWIETRLGKE